MNEFAIFTCRSKTRRIPAFISASRGTTDNRLERADPPILLCHPTDFFARVSWVSRSLLATFVSPTESPFAGSATNSDSMLSFSSSGVSSTGSLHLSTASEVEDGLELDHDVHSKVHISSTYISSSEVLRNETTNVEVRPYKDKPSHIYMVIFNAVMKYSHLNAELFVSLREQHLLFHRRDVCLSPPRCH